MNSHQQNSTAKSTNASGNKPVLNVVKIGGNVIDDALALQQLLHDFASIKGPAILVHGGGKIATRIGDQLGIVSQYIDGRRITDASTIDLVTMVYAGLVNKKIVAILQSLGSNAIGLTGADANMIAAQKRPVKQIDYGFVGDISKETINVQQSIRFLEDGLIPVFSPICHDGKGQLLNTNADTIASCLATALSDFYQVRLVYCFEKTGVLANINDEASVIPLIDREIYANLKSENKLFDGILPKIDNAFAAIDAGVNEVIIGHATDLLANLTDQVKGTMIK